MKPIQESLEKALMKWRLDGKWITSENAVRLVMKQFPRNGSVPRVLAKVSVLNDIYSTNIYNTHAVAMHIVSCRNVDRRLMRGDWSLVPEIAAMELGGKIRNNYSFATKYCAHHNREAFAIYDRYVDERLWHYKNAYGFSDFKRYELREYDTLMRVIRELQEFFGLRKYSLRDIDAWLWIEGKQNG